MNSPKTYCTRLFTIVLLSVSLTTAFAREKKKNKAPKEPQEQATEAVANDAPIFIQVDTMPTFPGGTDALISYVAFKLVYPREAQIAGAQGKVFVNFVVEKDGSVSNVKLARGVYPALDDEAVRVVRTLPKFNPGKKNGKLVRVSYTMPINFHLQ